VIKYQPSNRNPRRLRRGGCQIYSLLKDRVNTLYLSDNQYLGQVEDPDTAGHAGMSPGDLYWPIPSDTKNNPWLYFLDRTKTDECDNVSLLAKFELAGSSLIFFELSQVTVDI